MRVLIFPVVYTCSHRRFCQLNLTVYLWVLNQALFESHVARQFEAKCCSYYVLHPQAKFFLALVQIIVVDSESQASDQAGRKQLEQLVLKVTWLSCPPSRSSHPLSCPPFTSPRPLSFPHHISTPSLLSPLYIPTPSLLSPLPTPSLLSPLYIPHPVSFPHHISTSALSSPHNIPTPPLVPSPFSHIESGNPNSSPPYRLTQFPQ